MSGESIAYYPIIRFNLITIHYWKAPLTATKALAEVVWLFTCNLVEMTDILWDENW